LQFTCFDTEDDGQLTTEEIVKLLAGNHTLTRLTFCCDERKLETSLLSALVDAVRSNPHSSLTDLDASLCTPNEEGGAALVSLIALPRIEQLDLSLQRTGGSTAPLPARALLFATLQSADV
jgi:hypothetical protein